VPKWNWTTYAVAIAAMSVVAAIAAVSDSHQGSKVTASDDILLLYVGADDCAPCRVWQSGDGKRFRSSAIFAKIAYREVKSPSLFGLLEDENWPEDLRGYRQHLGPGTGVPLWLLIAGNQVVAQGFGAGQWRTVVKPRLQSLVRR
jgi:hypothetical protein